MSQAKYKHSLRCCCICICYCNDYLNPKTHIKNHVIKALFVLIGLKIEGAKKQARKPVEKETIEPWFCGMAEVSFLKNRYV